MNEYHRTIVDFLRDHGADNVRIVPGGKHPHVDFVFREKNFNLAVHRDPSGHSDAAIIKVKEMKTMLGEPDTAAPREARRLDDMTPRTNAHTPLPIIGSVAMYRTQNEKLQMRIFPPPAVVDLLGGVKHAVRVERMARDTWLLSSDPTLSRPHFYRDRKMYILAVGVVDDLTRGFDTPFGVTQAEYVEVDGKVVVRLLVDKIRPVGARKPKKQGIIDIKVPLAPSPDIPLLMSDTKAGRILDADPSASVEEEKQAAEFFFKEPLNARGSRLVEPTMADPRAVLAAISKIEAATPYRLVKSEKSGWIWQAPTIRLTSVC